MTSITTDGRHVHRAGLPCPACFAEARAPLEAEIARLRRIEEAARLLMYMHEQMGPQFIPHDEIALRAALEEKP